MFVNLYVRNSSYPVERVYVCTPAGLGIVCERAEQDSRIVRMEVEVEE